MHSIDIPLTYRRQPEDEGETPWIGEEAAIPASLVMAGVVVSILLIAVAAFVL